MIYSSRWLHCVLVRGCLGTVCVMVGVDVGCLLSIYRSFYNGGLSFDLYYLVFFFLASTWDCSFDCCLISRVFQLQFSSLEFSCFVFPYLPISQMLGSSYLFQHVCLPSVLPPLLAKHRNHSTYLSILLSSQYSLIIPLMFLHKSSSQFYSTLLIHQNEYITNPHQQTFPLLFPSLLLPFSSLGSRE